MTYLQRALSHSLHRGEAPFASHGLYTLPGVLDDNVPEERKMGMEAGHDWLAAADLVAVYEDYGITRGMEQGIRLAEQLGLRIEVRKIGPNM